MKLVHDVYDLFFPRYCAGCDNALLKNEKVLCLSCMHALPLAHFTDHADNPIEKIFYGRANLEAATALLYYMPKGISQKLIYGIKYKGIQETGTFLGNMLALEIQNAERFSNIDCIVPVPLDKLKMKKRGYNQLTTFGNALSANLGVPFVDNKLIRIKAAGSQTKKNRLERWKALSGQFKVDDISYFDNKHVLLIDDVITTGATLEACIVALEYSKNTKVSVAAMAFTE